LNRESGRWLQAGPWPFWAGVVLSRTRQAHTVYRWESTLNRFGKSRTKYGSRTYTNSRIEQMLTYRPMPSSSTRRKLRRIAFSTPPWARIQMYLYRNWYPGKIPFTKLAATSCGSHVLENSPEAQSTTSDREWFRTTSAVRTAPWFARDPRRAPPCRHRNCQRRVRRYQDEPFGSTHRR
jgi:hypothetical protein